MVSVEQFIVCGNCGAKNRLPALRRGRPRCGKCGTPLASEVAPSAGSTAMRVAPRATQRSVASWLFGFAAVVLLGAGGVLFLVPATPTSGPNASPPRSIVPRCASPPSNGQVLKSRIGRPDIDGGHVVEIRNGSGGSAIVKIKNAATKRTVLSFFVADSATASGIGIPDGSYLIQFAFGDDLDQTCTNFIADRATSEFPTHERLTTQVKGTESYTAHLTYTLYAIQSGNVTPRGIDPAVFDAD